MVWDQDAAVKVLIADDHELVLDTLVAFIEASGNMDVMTAPDFLQATQTIETHGPFDLVLLDLNMPGMNRLAGLKSALKMEKARHVAILTGDRSRALAEEALALGATGFVPKTLPAKSLVNAIQFMAMGEEYMPVNLMNADEPNAGHPLAQKLSQREGQVLRGLTEGKTNKEIARDLELSEPTIKLHVKTLYRKIGAANRTQAALIAKEAGLF